MRIGRNRSSAEAAAVSDSQRSSSVGDGGVVEIRPVDAIKVCASCLVINSSADAFCTACGAELPAAQAAEEHPTLEADLVEQARHAQPDVSASAGPDLAVTAARAPVVIHPPILIEKPRSSTTLERRHWLMIAAVVTLFALGVGGTATFVWLWHSEKTQARRLTAERDLGRSRLAVTAQKLTSAQASLKATTALASERKTVLVRAQGVLGKVDQLLSSVDGLQQKSGDVQSAGATLSATAETMKADMVTLGNYVIQTDQAYIDAGYEQQLIDTANADIASLGYQESQLGSSSSSYDAASSRFGTVANAFSASVRRLQQQLQRAAK